AAAVPRRGRAAEARRPARPGARRSARPSAARSRRARRSAPRARQDELATRATRVVDGLEELVVVIERLRDPFGLEPLRGHPAIQRVDRVLPGIEPGEQRGELLRRAAHAAKRTLAHGGEVEPRIGLGVRRPDDAGPVEIVRYRVDYAGRVLGEDDVV